MGNGEWFFLLSPALSFSATHERQEERRSIWGSPPHLFSTTRGKVPPLCFLPTQCQLPERKNAINHFPLEYSGTGLGKCGWVPRREDLGDIARVISYWYGNGYKGELPVTRERKAMPVGIKPLLMVTWRPTDSTVYATHWKHHIWCRARRGGWKSPLQWAEVFSEWCCTLHVQNIFKRGIVVIKP